MTRGATNADTDAQGEAGFTLVELLVALSLLSLIALALFASLRFGIFAWGRGTAHVEATDHISAAQNFLRRSIADAYPQFSSRGANRGQIAFEGTSTSLKLLGPSPLALGGAGRSWLTLWLNPQGAGADFVLVSQGELTDPQTSNAPVKKPLVANVQRIAFSYFGRKRSEQSAQWHDRWIGEATLPGLVRVRVDFPAGDARVWPELLVRPRIAADVGCVYETLTKSCRGR